MTQAEDSISPRFGSPMRGVMLHTARIAWFALAVLAVTSFVASVIPRYNQLRAVSPDALVQAGQLTPDDARSLADLGLSIQGYATYIVTLELLVALMCVFVATVIFWRRSDTMVVLLTALMLLTFGTGLPLSIALARSQAGWGTASFVLRALLWLCLNAFFYLFPDGRFVPRWTRWLMVASVLSVLVSVILPSIRLPIGVTALTSHQDVIGAVWFLAWTIMGVGSQMYRYQRVSLPIHRQQTKWVVFGFMLLVVIGVSVILVGLLIPALQQPGPERMLYRLISVTVLLCAFMLVPATFGMAILRSHLWDIDVLINRALVYGTLSTVLLVVYTGSVVLLQLVFRQVTGQSSEVVVVVSTLTIAALFQPLRRRIQAVIDRRFYRRKYDAQKTLQAFSARLRDETDLETLMQDMVAVVQETLQPAHITVWLRSRNATVTVTGDET